LSSSLQADILSDRAYIHDILPYKYTLVVLPKDFSFILALVPSAHAKLSRIDKRYVTTLFTSTLLIMIFAFFTVANDFIALLGLTVFITFPLIIFILIIPYNRAKRKTRDEHFNFVTVLWQKEFQIMHDEIDLKKFDRETNENVIVEQIGTLQLLKKNYSNISTLNDELKISDPIPYYESSEERRNKIIQRMALIQKYKKPPNRFDGLPCIITIDKRITTLIPLEYYQSVEEGDIHLRKLKSNAVVNLIYHYFPNLDIYDGNYYLVEDGLFTPNKITDSIEEPRVQTRFGF
jgi:hypothetical protein